MTAHTIVCFGEILMRLSEPGRGMEFTSPQLDWHVGGAEANVAVGLAGLGHTARMLSVLPDNPAGDTAARALRQAGVSIDTVRRQEGGRLGLYFHTSGADLRPGRITYDRENSAFAQTQAGDFDIESALNGADWCHVSGVTPAIGAASAEAACRLVEAACARDIPVSFDFNHRSKMWARWGGDPDPYLKRIVGCATLLFANDHDLARVVNIPEAERGRSLQHSDTAFAAFPKLTHISSAYRNLVSVERQSLRAELVTRNARLTTDQVDMRAVVDRIGGGDAFASAMISGVLRDKPSQRCLDEALAASVLKHSVPGDFSRHTEQDLDEYLSTGAGDVRR